MESNSGWASWGVMPNTTSGGTYYSSGTSLVAQPTTIYVNHPIPLPGVLESPSAPLSDREWLDAQITEVCALA